MQAIISRTLEFKVTRQFIPNVISFMLMVVLKYILFFLKIMWRSVVIALIGAVLAGLALGSAAHAQQWSPDQFDTASNLVGLIVALGTVIGVITLETMSVIRKCKA